MERKRLLSAYAPLSILFMMPAARASTISSISSSFVNTPISAGNTIWFGGALELQGNYSESNPIQISFSNSNIQFSANSTPFNIAVPNATVTFSPATSSPASTSSASGWTTLARFDPFPISFLDLVSFTAPSSGLPAGLSPVTWTGSFSTNTPNLELSWQWAAIVSSSFNTGVGFPYLLNNDDGRSIVATVSPTATVFADTILAAPEPGYSLLVGIILCFGLGRLQRWGESRFFRSILRSRTLS